LQIYPQKYILLVILALNTLEICL